MANERTNFRLAPEGVPILAEHAPWILTHGRVPELGPLIEVQGVSRIAYMLTGRDIANGNIPRVFGPVPANVPPHAAAQAFERSLRACFN